jgi:hypothetical protein
MNSVILESDCGIKYKTQDLIGKNIGKYKETAFLGRINTFEGLFLINYSCIMKADDPTKTWDAGTFIVDKFVDVEIRVKQRKQLGRFEGPSDEEWRG